MFVSVLSGITVLSLAIAWPALSKPPETLTADDVARQFCALPPTEAQVSPEDIVNEEASVQVPSQSTTDMWKARALEVRLGEVVKLNVSSEQAGAAGVHGLSTIQPMHPGAPITVQFRAIYSGRFPLHFHGTDGSHFELIAVNVTGDANARAHN